MGQVKVENDKWLRRKGVKVAREIEVETGYGKGELEMGKDKGYSGEGGGEGGGTKGIQRG